MPTLNEEKRKKIEELLNKKIDELYILIASSDPAYIDVFFEPEEAKRMGRSSFKSLEKALFHKICREWNYCKKRHSPDLSDSVTLVTAIADVIIAVVGGIPSLIIAVLLVKKGLNIFCECDDDE